MFAGRLEKGKRPDEALKVFKVIKDEITDARLWIVGDGGMVKELKTMVQRMFPRDSSDISFYGMQNATKRLELMSRAHLILVPGVKEGWASVVTEANSMGTPSVAYDVPGLRDAIIHDETGSVVENKDYVAMTNQAIELLINHITRKTYSRNALRDAKAFQLG